MSVVTADELWSLQRRLSTIRAHRELLEREIDRIDMEQNIAEVVSGWMEWVEAQ